MAEPVTFNCPSLPLTQDEIVSNVLPIDDSEEKEVIEMITIQTKKRKLKPKKNLVSMKNGSIGQFRHYFPQYSYLLTQPYSYPLETLLIQSIIDVLRPFFLTKNTLILDSFDVSRLCAYHREKNFTELTDEYLSLIENGQNINQVNALVYSTTQQAIDNSLVMDFQRISDTDKSVDSNMGHFVFYSLNFETLDVKIIDTYSSDVMESPYFTIEQFKKLSNCLLKASNSQSRRVKSIAYKRTQYKQKDRECGLLSLLHMFLSFENDLDFLCNYSLKNYANDLSNFRSILAEILLTNQMPLDKLKIN